MGQPVVLLAQVDHSKAAQFSRLHITMETRIDLVLRFAMHSFKGLHNAAAPPEWMIASVELAWSRIEADDVCHRVRVSDVAVSTWLQYGYAQVIKHSAIG